MIDQVENLGRVPLNIKFVKRKNRSDMLFMLSEGDAEVLWIAKNVYEDTSIYAPMGLNLIELLSLLREKTLFIIHFIVVYLTIDSRGDIAYVSSFYSILFLLIYLVPI